MGVLDVRETPRAQRPLPRAPPVLAVVVHHREIQSVDALEVFRIKHVLGASPMDRFSPEIRLKQAQDRPEIDMQGKPSSRHFFQPGSDLPQESIQNQTG